MSTVAQIEAVVGLSERFGGKIATAAEARESQKIGVWYDSIDETLQNLGMPPNREGAVKGFTVSETDGKKRTHQPAGDSHPFPSSQRQYPRRKPQDGRGALTARVFGSNFNSVLDRVTVPVIVARSADS